MTGMICSFETVSVTNVSKIANACHQPMRVLTRGVTSAEPTRRRTAATDTVRQLAVALKVAFLMPFTAVTLALTALSAMD